MNEYGAVQQHLEPEHVRDILIPVPDDLTNLVNLLKETEELIKYKELVAENLEKSLSSTNDLVQELISRNSDDLPGSIA